ncbi:helix-turn-helix transcriptional regulator [Halobacillus sp. Marseille-Q1614]|uniref:helix-turn-helix transcriptional regulator n=1 Tax=Halobacillus sp. Marseille-Q1614 TaxID=2709134 RepID=UPI00156F8A45|nr:AraC family transcriptional regulator [Halobacillus sp. Marseille-Q1614]
MIVTNENGLLLLRNDYLGERDWRRDNCYKIIFSPIGRGEYQIRQGDLSIERGSFLVMNPNEDHKQLKAVQEKLLVELQPSIIRQAAEQLEISQREPEFSMIAYKHPQIQQWIGFVREFLLNHKDKEINMNSFFLENSLTQLSILLLQYGAGTHLNDFPGQSYKGNISMALNALKESYKEDWTLDEMAKAARLTKFQFARQFKEELGLSPYSWLQLYRLFRSHESLIHSKDSVLTIALFHGFKSVSSYNYLFKKVYRRTPTEFRSSYR